MLKNKGIEMNMSSKIEEISTNKAKINQSLQQNKNNAPKVSDDSKKKKIIIVGSVVLLLVAGVVLYKKFKK